jgi:hypothetical protein
MSTPSAKANIDRACELNASDRVTYWKALKFISHAEQIKNPEFVSTNDSFRIFHKQLEGYLSVKQRSIDQLLPK